jgi:hypothetical protein
MKNARLNVIKKDVSERGDVKIYVVNLKKPANMRG